jgi:type I restriction enzyme, S subunit
MEKQNKIPILRFPQFKKEWEIQKVGNLTNRISNPVKVEHEELYQQIGIRSHGKGIFHKELIDGKGLGDKRVFWVKENTFIVNIVFAWEQAVAKTTSKEVGMIASHRFPMYEPIENKSNLEYLLYFFLTKKGKALLELASPGGAGRNKTLGQKEFENLKFLIPPSTEQEKIASFITSINQKIQALKDKKNLLTKYKKGVMQQLFSQALRFKNTEGGDFEDWEVKKLGEVCEINPKSSVLPSSFIYIDLESVVNGVLLKEQRIEKQEAPSRAQRLLSKNDVLFQMVRPYQMNNLFFDKKGDYVASTGYAQIRTKQNAMFIFQYLHFQNFVDKVIERCTGTSYPAINSTDLANIEVSIPCIEEQTHIAHYLSAIDAKIQGVTAQIEKMDRWKKGLLQQMFV